MSTARLRPNNGFDVPPWTDTCLMTRQLRLIEIPTIREAASTSPKLSNRTRYLGRRGVAEARAALAAAQHLHDVDLDAA